ncbi:sugar transferase [Natronomonas halophila]|uniref:sugar transferase n=1 Tax=Natronomonas halophila TaxID=2747817 RepID=UPI0015B3D5C8|nr:sugar transferase [Natronomonas halophila]QLD86830.1 sugar transferase [Natronomonas halophila]
MTGGWRYRIASVLGVVSLSVLAVRIANVPALQAGFALIPVIGHLPFEPAYGAEFAFEAATTALVMLAALVPLYKPRPRRILDAAELATRRVLLGCIALAAIGYFDYTYRLPRATLVVAGALVLVTIPLWFVAIRRRPRGETGRTLIVGDDPETMGDILNALNGGVVGYVSPPSAYFGAERGPQPTVPASADGGRPETLDELACLGGLSRLDEVLVEYDIDTVALAFAQPDRAEFFGTLDACYEYGVTAKVHREHADSVLTTGFGSEELVDVDLEPWDPLDHVMKRIFDTAFAGLGLLALSPVMLVIAAAVKLEDGGSVLYRQERTASFGDTFRVYKFRSMVENVEDAEPVDDGKNPYITRVGAVVRRTHLDEIPQLWSILKGDMSVVGPRAAWVEEEVELESVADDWRKRWFVKPGLTGLAQINDVSSTEPEKKLRYDVEYIRRQSLWFDLKIVVRQIWLVGKDFIN